MLSTVRSFARDWLGRGTTNFAETQVDLVTPRRRAQHLPFNRFASLLPYTGYDEEHRLFIIESDQPGVPEGLGFTLEIRPQIGASQEMADFLTNIYTLGAPAGTGLQVQMYGSPVLEDLFAGMLGITISPDQSPYPEQARLLQKMAERRVAYYRRGATSALAENFNYRMRNYRSNISVVVPTTDVHSEGARRDAAALRQQLITTLNQYFLFQHEWEPEHLINFVSLLLNPHRTLGGDFPDLSYDDGKEIRYQIIAGDTRAEESETEIVYSGGDFDPIATRAMSAMKYPKNFGLNHIGNLLGSSTSTAIAYPCPFLVTLGVTLPAYEAENNITTLKAARAQQTADNLGRVLPHLQDINDDWRIAQRAFAEGPGTCSLYHQILLFAPKDDLVRVEQAAKAVWRSERYEITTDRKMQKQGVLASLPMMYGPLLQKDLKTAHRTSKKTVFNAANMMPIIAEWTGTPPREHESFSRPVLTLFGRRGQAMTIDIFANPSGNYNGIVVGTSGSGKTFFLNELTQRTLATGGRVWIIDVGRGYENLCRQMGGQYIEFTENSGICLNFFSIVEDIDKDMEMVKPLVAQMMSPSRPLEDLQLAQLEMHIRSTWLQHGTEMTITHLADALVNNCSLGGPALHPDDPEYRTKLAAWRQKVEAMEPDERQKYCDPRIRDLGTQLFAFTEEGAYGKYFHGKANIDFRSNFIVLELEELKSKKDLQSVVMLMLMYQITQVMYLSDRSQAKLVIIDEAWDLMGSGNSGSFIEAGYRRARRYGGAFFTATQSIEDYYKSETAKAAFQNADWMFLLRQKAESVEQLANSGKFAMDDHTRRLLRSVTRTDMYSEVYVRGGDLPPTVGRLFVDPFSLLSASSRASDFEAVRAAKARGLSTEDAIEAVLEERTRAVEARKKAARREREHA